MNGEKERMINPAIHRVGIDNSVQWIKHEGQTIMFVNTPKNASTTIREYWNVYKSDYSDFNDVTRLNKASLTLDSQFRICVIVRDPLARHISATAMISGTIEHDYGIRGLTSDDFVELHRVRDVHLIPQWAFVPLCMPKGTTDQKLMMGPDKYSWNDLYRDTVEEFGFENLVNEQYDFFWMSEDPNQNVWTDICKHYGMRVWEEKHNVATYREDRPISNLPEIISTVHSAYDCDYDFQRRVNFVNVLGEKREKESNHNSRIRGR